jgi:hypothetical protein
VLEGLADEVRPGLLRGRRVDPAGVLTEAGAPVDADVGEQLVAVDGILGERGRRVGPFLELLDDPG